MIQKVVILILLCTFTGIADSFLIGSCNTHLSPVVRKGSRHHHVKFVINADPQDNNISNQSTVQESLEAEYKDDEQQQQQDDEEEEATLILKGEILVQSNPLPIQSEHALKEFFQRTSYRNLLISGGGERPVEGVDATKDLLHSWNAQCKSLGAMLPDFENDSIISVVSRGIQFPGLTVESTATIGIKYIDVDGQTTQATTPRHEFVLLSTKEKARGLPPVVWIYNKLTGANQNKDNSNAKSLSTINYFIENDKVIFQTKAFLRIGVTFPKMLLKILPGDKDTIEQKAGVSIQKALLKDVTQSMEAYEKAYLERFRII